MRIVPVLASPRSRSSARRARALLTLILVLIGIALGVVAGALWRRPKADGGLDMNMPGMDMSSQSKPAAEKPTATTYYCPMHPSYRSEKPGDCPVCNMTLVPLEQAGPAAEAPSVEGHAAVTITPQRQQLIGVKTGVVERKPATRTIRAVGRVEYNERTLSTVSLKYGGWIQELYVKSTGESVEIGQPLFTIYSPELFEAQRAYALTRTTLAASASGLGGALALDQDVGRGLRQKLLLWDMSEQQVADLEARGNAEQLTTVFAKSKGVVTLRDVTAGAYVEPGKMLYSLADISSVWILAEVYESEVGALSLGTEVTIALESEPGEHPSGRIVYVYPYLNEPTRTTRVRIEAENPDWKLKPGMYATVSIAVDLGEQLVISDDAILDTGTRKIAFVTSGEGRFEPREVTLVWRGDGRAIVKSGLQADEQVVTSATFLVDSESRLQAALQAGMQSMPGMEGMDMKGMEGMEGMEGKKGTGDTPKAPTGGHQH